MEMQNRALNFFLPLLWLVATFVIAAQAQGINEESDFTGTGTTANRRRMFLGQYSMGYQGYNQGFYPYVMQNFKGQYPVMQNNFKGQYPIGLQGYKGGFNPVGFQSYYGGQYPMAYGNYFQGQYPLGMMNQYSYQPYTKGPYFG